MKKESNPPAPSEGKPPAPQGLPDTRIRAGFDLGSYKDGYEDGQADEQQNPRLSDPAHKAAVQIIQQFKRSEMTILEGALNVLANHAKTIQEQSAELARLQGLIQDQRATIARLQGLIQALCNGL